MFGSPWLGQVALILGPSSWGAGMRPTYVAPVEEPPFYGEWGVVDADMKLVECGIVGPFDTSEEAFTAAAKAAGEHGATKMPIDGFAQAVDSSGQAVGPVK